MKGSNKILMCTLLSLDTLTAKEKAFLGALMHTSLLEKKTMIDLTHGIPVEFAPTYAYGEEIILRLLKRKILLPYDESDRTCSSLYDTYQHTYYTIHIQEIENVLSDIMYPKALPEEDKDEILGLLQEIRLHEAVEYMHDLLQQFHLGKFVFEPRYKQLFIEILKTYSMGQLFNFIYTAIRNQAAHKQRDPHAYVPLSNYIYKKILNRFERARLEGWNITSFNQSWGHQQSELSKLVCSRLLKISEAALHESIGAYQGVEY